MGVLADRLPEIVLGVFVGGWSGLAMEHNIVLIGNAPVERDWRERVEEAHFVVRFNVPRDTEATTGRRCDALCISNYGDPARRIAKYRQLADLKVLEEGTEVWFPRRRQRRAWTCLVSHPIRAVRHRLDFSALVLKRNGLMGHGQVFFSEGIWWRAYSLLALDREGPCQPSTGFLALVYCLGRFPPAIFRTWLLGFTFEGSAVHCWEAEKKFVEKLVAQGVLIWERPGG